MGVLGKNMTFGQKASLYWALGAGRFGRLPVCFDGVVYRTQTIICNFRKTYSFWVKALIISAILLLAFPTERVDYG